ncbi:MAG: hypothetical protein CME19_05145 [Gemmatimonadetes bacterium]|nr:hypothetical protein [Gemmatimonadota bacterium]
MGLPESLVTVLEAATLEAQRLGHRYVGTEHLLLAVCLDPAKVREILVELDLDPLDLRSQVDAFVIKSDPLKSEEHIPVSPRALKALARSIEESQALGAPEPMLEHVLLMLAEDEDGVAARVLEVFGIDYASIRRFLV